MNIDYLTEPSAVTLVDRRPEKWPHALWVTISPNPKTLHSCYRTVTNGIKQQRVLIKLPYGKLPQKAQYAYCIRVLQSCYNYSENTKIFGTWELNKSGDVHFHFIMSDPLIKGPTMLKILQRDVLNHELVMKNLSKKLIDYMNNICYVTDSIENRFQYMTKDMDHNIEIMPYYCSNL